MRRDFDVIGLLGTNPSRSGNNADLNGVPLLITFIIIIISAWYDWNNIVQEVKSWVYNPFHPSLKMSKTTQGYFSCAPAIKCFGLGLLNLFKETIPIHHGLEIILIIRRNYCLDSKNKHFRILNLCNQDGLLLHVLPHNWLLAVCSSSSSKAKDMKWD